MDNRETTRMADPTPDLCDHYLMVPDHRCNNRWREAFVLDEPVTFTGSVMFGTYHPGTWRFCRIHARIFKRDSGLSDG
jgi:hypothetical protein